MNWRFMLTGNNLGAMMRTSIILIACFCCLLAVSTQAQESEAYIKTGATALGVGGELVDKKAVNEKRFNIITENTRAFLRTVRKARAV